MQASVTVHMDATPDAVWALVSDITRIGEFSPETFEAQWLGGATGPALGARFRGHVKRNEKGPVYWSTCEVTSCDPGRDFGFAVLAGSRSINNWRYVIAATPAGGSDVTESFALTPSIATRIYWAAAGRLRGRRNRNDMRRTLERIKAVVEA
jgi:hypothetical protein